MTTPDAAIKAAAEAIYAARGYAGISHDDTGETRSVWASSVEYAEAAAPAFREAIAREIDAYADRGEPMTDHQRGWKAGTADAARIVRGGTP